MPTEFPPETLLYLWTCPGTAEFGYVAPQAFGALIAESKSLPENLRKALVDESSAEKVRNLALRKHRLPLEQAQNVARVLGRILRGEESAASLGALLERHVEAAGHVREGIAKDLVQEFITPNYFQIAQLYEKKHGPEAREIPRSANTPDKPERAEQTFPTISPTSTRLTAPPRVVDLRNGAIPKRLPATPSVTPPPETQDASPDHQSTPTLLPTSPMRGGPSADDLLKTFGTRPAPSSPSGGPRNGPHGPLPPPLTER